MDLLPGTAVQPVSVKVTSMDEYKITTNTAS